jgi:RND superfamily putative drug exporter
VLLDTFVVRPILVPAWLMMLHQGHLGEAGRYLGAPARPSASTPPAAPQAVTLPK